MDVAVILVLLIVGVSLLLVEFFLIPGLSIAGIGGLIFLFGGVYYAYAYVGPEAGHLALLGTVVLVAFAVWAFIKSKALERLSLKTEIDGKNDPMQGINVQVGEIGNTVSRLAPMGKIKIRGQVVEARAMDDFIDPDTDVVVVEVRSTNVLVERVPEVTIAD